ncbi:MAG: ATP-binding protein [bacterium]
MKRKKPSYKEQGKHIRKQNKQLENSGGSDREGETEKEDIKKINFFEDATRACEGRLPCFAVNSPDIMLRWRPGQGVVYVNPALESITGYSPGEVIGNPGFLVSKIHPEDVPYFTSEIQTPEQKEGGRKPIEFRMIAKSGSVVWFEAIFIPVWNEEGVFLAFECIGRDISKFKEAEEELQENYIMQFVLNELLRISLMDVSLDSQLEVILHCLTSIPWLAMESGGGILLLEDEPQVLKMKVIRNIDPALGSECVQVLFGQCQCGEAALTGKAVFSSHSDSRRKNQDDCTFAYNNYSVPILSGDMVLGVINLRFMYGEQRTEKTAEFLRAIADVVSGIIKRRRAEKEKEELQKQLLHVQKMEAIGQLAGGIAHSFKNMLTIIMGNAKMGVMNLKPEEPCHKEFAEIIKASERASELTTQLLTFARKEKINVQPVHINSVLKDLIDMLGRTIRKGITIKSALSVDIPPVNIDFNQMYQALLNISNNACDAMPDGGILTIESGEAFLDDDYCASRPEIKPGKYCLVQVSDTGVGIPEDELQRIFEPFFTTKDKGKGTGLGLSVTFGIIRNHGGHISVHSKPGSGTAVKIFLPLIV